MPGAVSSHQARLRLLLVVACVSSGLATQLPADSASAAPSTTAYHAVTPTRVLDTRIPLGAAGRVAGGSAIDVKVGGATLVPAEATAIVVNLTATEASGPGFVTAWPTGQPRPATSVINYERPGQTIANLVTVPIGANGSISLFAYAAVDLVADVEGYYKPAATTTAGRLVTTVPTRVLDTRNPNPVTQGPVAGGQAVIVDLAPFGVPADASAAVLKVTITEATRPGFWTVYAGGAARPTASNVNVDVAGQTIPNQVITPLANAQASVFAQTGGHLIVDLVGWFTGASAPSGTDGLFVPVAPARLIDTRDPANGPGVRPGIGQHVEVAVAGRAGIPASGVGAVLVNATATDAVSVGFFSVWPSRTYRPTISSLNATAAGQTIANHVITPVTGAGFDFYTQNGANLVADVTGWYTGAPTPTELPAAVPLPGVFGPPEVGAYAYSAATTGPGSGISYDVAGPQYTPVRWNPCLPIRFEINMNSWPETFRRTVLEAVERVSTATGITFKYVGDTTFVPTSTAPTTLTGTQSRNRSGPYDLIISLADESITDLIAGSSVIGLTDGFYGQGRGGNLQILAAAVVVDMGQVAANAEWGTGGPGQVLLHELGHSVGLDHVPNADEMMYYAAAPSVPFTYANGDLRGLWQVGPARGCLP